MFVCNCDHDVIVCVDMVFFFSSIRRHTRCALVTGVQTCALPIYSFLSISLSLFIPTMSLEFRSHDLDQTVIVNDLNGYFVSPLCIVMTEDEEGARSDNADYDDDDPLLLNSFVSPPMQIQHSAAEDRKSVVTGTGWSARVDIGGRRIIKK